MLSKVEPTNRTDDKLDAYRSLPLVNLIIKIVENSDEKAIYEFHSNRRVFFYDNDDPLLFVEFLEKLRDDALIKQKSWLSSYEVGDRAYNLMIDKFTHIPKEIDFSPSFPKRVKSNGSDCRLYYRAFVKGIEKSFREKPPKGTLEEETRAAQMLQGLVRRHFYLSVLEAERNANPMWSRYYWNVDNRSVCVWLPVTLSGSERRAWLEKHIDGIDLDRPRERQRIQAKINRGLARTRILPFNDALHTIGDNTNAFIPDWGDSFGKSLAKVVAVEKAATIDQQRRSIKKLGKKKLKNLILRIYEDIGCDDDHDSQIAKRYGLSKATFSRFAGRRWNKSGTNIPDLWLNTARVLSMHPDFKQAAKDTGVWNQVKKVLKYAKGKTKKVSQDESR